MIMDGTYTIDKTEKRTSDPVGQTAVGTEKKAEIRGGDLNNDNVITVEVVENIEDTKEANATEVIEGEFTVLETSGISSNVENDLENGETKDKIGMRAVFRRILGFILCVSGVLSYTYLGVYGVNYLKNGGFKLITANMIFGGLISDPVDPITNDNITPEKTNNVPEVTTDTDLLKISSEDIGCTEPIVFFNETEYDTDTGSVSASAVVPEFGNEGTALIIHTHGTEGYAEEVESVSADEDFRTDDPEKSVVAVGKAFAEILESRGIKTIHCTEMFDSESYIDAYTRSADAVSKYLDENPQISYVIDIHRDAVIREDGTVIKSDSGDGAQLMIVCGTDEMGADFPDWRENLAFGVEYQTKLFEKNENLMRHINLRSASFNQQLCDRYLLLEVGTCGNTLSEAIKSAEIAADVFADVILQEN